MARREWGQNGKCTYKKATLIVCSINILVALYVLHAVYTSLYIYPLGGGGYHTIFRSASDQIRKTEESNRIRKAFEPIELIKLVTQLKKTFVRDERVNELPRHLKQKLIGEILNRLRSLNAAANTTEQREAVEIWRKEKQKEATDLIRGKTLNSNILPQEAGVASRALSSDWEEFVEEIGLWIREPIINNEHDDKPEGEDEFEKETLPGKQLPPECHAELHTDYDGAAVRWGLTHHKESAYDCFMACLDQAKRAKPGQKKCNIWVYCPSETGCYSPDKYQHKNQECWLKYSETPKLNFKDTYSESYRDAHPNAPVIVPWVAGVISV